MIVTIKTYSHRPNLRATQSALRVAIMEAVGKVVADPDIDTLLVSLEFEDGTTPKGYVLPEGGCGSL